MQLCLYDVHGNLPALEAVLADAGPVDGYVLGGDYALFGGWPSETVARLRELEPAIWIRGNCERLVADPDGALVNPGSVGLPCDGDPRAAYAVIHDDGRVEHRRVEYDVAASAAKVRSLAPWGENVAGALHAGRRWA